MSKNPWIRVERPYNGGVLVLMRNTRTGKDDVLFSNQWQETSRPMWNNEINALVREMRESLTA